MAEIIHQPRTKSFFLRSDWLSPLTTSPLCSQSTASLLVGFLELTCKVETTLLWTPKKQEESGTRRQHASPPASHFLVSMTGSTRRLMRYNAPVRQRKVNPGARPLSARLAHLTTDQSLDLRNPTSETGDFTFTCNGMPRARHILTTWFLLLVLIIRTGKYIYQLIFMNSLNYDLHIFHVNLFKK